MSLDYKNTLLAHMDARKRIVEKLVVEGMPDPLYLRKITAGERDDFEVNWKEQTDTKRAYFACIVLSDPEGNAVFTPDEETLTTLKNMPGDILDKVLEKGLVFNKITDEDDIEGK